MHSQFFRESEDEMIETSSNEMIREYGKKRSAEYALDETNRLIKKPKLDMLRLEDFFAILANLRKAFVNKNPQETDVQSKNFFKELERLTNLYNKNPEYFNVEKLVELLPKESNEYRQSLLFLYEDQPMPLVLQRLCDAMYIKILLEQNNFRGPS